MKMKNLTNPECEYSFEMLYRAAFGKNIPKKEKLKLQSLEQEEINQLVRVWANKAGWKTEIRKGTDGREYIAFYEDLNSARPRSRIISVTTTPSGLV